MPIPLRKLTLVLALLLVAGGLVLLVQRPVAVDSAAVQPRVRACLLTQGESSEQNAETVECLKQVMLDAARDRRFGEILAMREDLQGNLANASCHAAGHAAGLDLYERYGMPGTIERVFTGPEEFPEQVCTAALVHGLVAASTDVAGKSDPSRQADVATVAGHCLSLLEVNRVYVNECAHFLGHAVWRAVGELGPDLASLCSHLVTGEDHLFQRTCISGAVMQKFDLQTKHYDPLNAEAKRRSPPTRIEMEDLCTPFVGGEETALQGCMGALGWLAAVKESDPVATLARTDPEWEEKALAIYEDAVSVCDGNYECNLNFINHLTIETFTAGLAPRVCAAAAFPEDPCAKIIERFTSTPRS